MFSSRRLKVAPSLPDGRLLRFRFFKAQGLGFARVASADLPSGDTSLREVVKVAPNCRPASLSVRVQAVCRPGDSASPGWLQPISLRETLLFEKWSRTLRVCLMADFYAYAPLAAAVGARASCVGRANGRSIPSHPKPSPSLRRSEAERRSLPSGRLGAYLSLLEEKCLPKGDRLKPPGRSLRRPAAPTQDALAPTAAASGA